MVFEQEMELYDLEEWDKLGFDYTVKAYKCFLVFSWDLCLVW